MRPETKNADHSAGAARRKRGFLARLKGDASGNALMLTAACMIPIAAAIGGGVDMSRAYLAKARLNQACDAAAIAGRRAMTNEDVETAKPEATKFFNFNFPQGTMQTAAFIPKITRPDTGVIRVEAATTVPTSIMKIFDYTQIPISVSCDATQNFDNIDIVLVLDVTGSMAYDINDQWRGDTDPNSKMFALREAMKALHSELSPAQAQLEAQGMRLRYGIVPYSAGVNVGGLIREINSAFLISGNYTYQSREKPETLSEEFSPTNLNKSQCTSYQSGSVVETSTSNSVTKIKYSQGSKTYTKSSGSGACSRYRVRTKYTARSFDTTNFVKKGSTVDVGPLIYGSTENVAWNGCIEERQTVSTITESSTPGIENANDLNIDLIPNGTNATRWAPSWPQLVYNPDNNGRATNYCPVAATRLTSMTAADMTAKATALQAVGSTYHDIGMIWGARMISRNSIFRNDLPGNAGSGNPETFNNRPVRKYIIFMSDGVMEPSSGIYEVYGVETLDRRIMGGNYHDSVSSGKYSNLAARHTTRFLSGCDSAKSMGVSVWTISFSLNDMQSLRSCASNADQYARSSSSAALIAKFKEIGKNIGALRIAK